MMERSESIKNIAKAIGLFRMKVEKIKKTSDNPFFKKKYAGLPEIMDAIATPLEESGLTFTQFPDGDSLTTILIHIESGEFFQASYVMHPEPEYTKEKDGGKVVWRSEPFYSPQAIGSCLTYMRRYALGAILSLNVVEDDDANVASGRREEIQPKRQEPEKPPAQKKTLMTDAVLQKVLTRMQTDKTALESAKKVYEISDEQLRKLEAVTA